MLKMLKSDEELIFDINEEPKPLNGYIMQAPQIKLGKEKEAYVKNGEIKLKERVLDPYHFKDFIYCYSVAQKKHNDDKAPDYDREDADYAF